MTRRPIAVLLFGAVLRELLPALRKLADWMDPAGTATQAWDPQPVAAPVVVEDYVPEYMLREQR